MLILNKVPRSVIQDYYSTTTGKPPVDAEQNYNLTNSKEENGTTYLWFTRKRDTNDSKDVLLEVKEGTTTTSSNYYHYHYHYYHHHYHYHYYCYCYCYYYSQTSIKRSPSVKRSPIKVPEFASLNCCKLDLYLTVTSIKRTRSPFIFPNLLLSLYFTSIKR